MYPIPVKGSTLREDLHALEACRLIKIRRLSDEAHILLNGSPLAVANAADPAVAGGSPAGNPPEVPGARPAAQHRRHHQRLLLSFKDLMIHQVNLDSSQAATAAASASFSPLSQKQTGFPPGFRTLILQQHQLMIKLRQGRLHPHPCVRYPHPCVPTTTPDSMPLPVDVCSFS